MPSLHALQKHSYLHLSRTFPRLSFCPQTFLSAPCTHVYLYVFDKSSSESAANAWSELANLQGFLYGDYTHNHFAAFDLTSISGLKVHSGSSHDAVKPARKTLHRILSDLTERPDVKLAIVTIPSAHRHKGHQAHVKRQRPQSHLPSPMPRPAEIDSISTCYSSAETCGNATSSYSGHSACEAMTRIARSIRAPAMTEVDRAQYAAEHAHRRRWPQMKGCVR